MQGDEGDAMKSECDFCGKALTPQTVWYCNVAIREPESTQADESLEVAACSRPCMRMELVIFVSRMDAKTKKR